MNANFTFPPPKPVMPRPPSAYRPKAKAPSRSSNALRASVLEAALELGVGTNPLVSDWMFSNSLKEEDEEDSAHSPGLTNGSSATSEESSSYPLTPPASSSKRGPGPGVHFADDPVSNGKPSAVAVVFPSAGKDAAGRSSDADNSNSSWSHEHGVAPSSLAPSGSGSGIPFPDMPIPPRPTTPNNGRKLKKKRGEDGGYENDGGYVSDSGKKKEKKEKKEKREKRDKGEEKDREGEGGEGERTRKKSLISVVKSSKKKDKDKDKEKDASFDVGYDTDGGPTSSAKKPKKPSKSKAKTAEAGYETDGYVSSSGSKRSKARAFFGLSSKSSRTDLHAEAEPVPALPRGFGGKEMPLPIADRFATTLSPTNTSAGGSSATVSPTSPASPSSSMTTPLGRTTSDPSTSASSPISPSPSATQLLGTGTLPQMSFQPFSAADSADTQLSPSRSRSPLPPPSRSRSPLPPPSRSMSPVASPTLSPTIKRDSLMSTNSSSSSGSGSNSNSQNHGQQHPANGSSGSRAGAGGAGGGGKRRFFGFASPTKGDGGGHGTGSGSGSTITSTSTSAASHTHSAKSASNASSATTHSAAGSLKPPVISFPLTRTPSPSGQPMSPGRSPTPTAASVLPFASSSSQAPASSSLASPLSPSSASQLPMRSPSPGLPRSPASSPPVVPLNINKPGGAMRVRPSLEKLNLLAPPINSNAHGSSLPSPISPSSYVMVTPVPSPGLPPSPNPRSRSMTRGGGGNRDGMLGPPSPGIVPSGDYLVPSPSPAATGFMRGASPAPGVGPGAANGGLTSPNVLAYYDMPPPSPPPQGPLPSVPPNAQPAGSSSSASASASVNAGQFPSAALRQRVVDRTPRHLPPELANVQRGRESPFPARPVLPAGGVAPPAGMPRRYRDLYASPTGAGPGEETLAYLEEKGRAEEMRRARIAGTGGQRRAWVDLEEVERDMVKEKLMKIQRKKKKGAVRFAVDVDGGSEDEDELEYEYEESVEDEPELRGVLDRFDNGSAEGASASEESVFSQRALSRNRSAEALNVDAEGTAVPRLRVPRERPRQLSEYTDDDVRTLGDRMSRWSDSVYSRVSILDEDESEQTRDRFVRRVEAMLEAERKRNLAEGLVGDETGGGLGMGRGYIPPVPKLPDAYSNSNLSASPLSAGANSPVRSWNKF